MKNGVSTLIKKIGINKCLREDAKFFSFTSSEEVIVLPEHMPNIKKIVSIMIEPEIITQNVINTIRGKSSDGEYLSGKKIIIHMKLKQKMLYEADVEEETIHTIENEYFQSAYIVIPPIIEGSDPEELLKFEYLKTQVYVENIVIEKINERAAFKNISLLIDAFFVPTYGLSYSIREKESNIFVSYPDGSHKKQITYSKNDNHIMPTWSPAGGEIAFLSDMENNEGKYMIYIYCLADRQIKKITDSNQFDKISSFCWSGDGKSIIFSGVLQDEKQLFSIDINTLEYHQLTFGNNEIRNYRPKASPVDKKVVFLQSISGFSNLCMMDVNTMSVVKLTSSGFVKDFDWSKDGNVIVYVWGRSGEYNEICLIDLKKLDKKLLNIPTQIIAIRNVQFSPDNNHIAFIGSDLEKDNIFSYDLREDHIMNLTNNFNRIKISDFAWKTDSSSIYYGANDFEYYNIYMIAIKDQAKYCLTSTTASDIRLSYRPKII